MAVQAIAHKNHYDFTQKHRHTYYEILFFETGGGTQLIDFEENKVRDFSCYLVQPNQIHLLRRDGKSKGKLIQFRTLAITSQNLLTKLRERIWESQSAVVFEEDKASFGKMMELLDLFRSDGHDERDIHLLQVLLHDVLFLSRNSKTGAATNSELNTFLRTVDENFRAQHSVKFYLAALGQNEKKLGLLTKAHLGLSPLQVIHQRILLETRRLLLFGKESHKEIAYYLGFDSPASFSAFVKKKTGSTPSDLQAVLEEIHK